MPPKIYQWLLKQLLVLGAETERQRAETERQRAEKLAQRLLEDEID